MNLDAGKTAALMVETRTRECEGAQDVIGCRECVKVFILDLVDRIGMLPLDLRGFEVPLTPDNVDHPSKDDGGVTVQCVISTSHVAYHAWPLQHRFRLVVDSCKDFDIRVLLEATERFFPVKRYSIQVIPYEPPTIPGRFSDEQIEQGEAEATGPQASVSARTSTARTAEA